jgi:hypothetical protein
MKEKEKIVEEIIKTQMEDAVVLAKAIPAEEDAEEDEEDAAEEDSEHLKMWNVSIVAKMATILLTAQSQEK